MGRLFAVEVVYRGFSKKTLSKRITRAIVLQRIKKVSPASPLGRYGDSPERNGIPARPFAIVATDDITLEEGMAKYEPKEVDVTSAWTTRCGKGVSLGLGMGAADQRLTKPNGTLIVTRAKSPRHSWPCCHRKETPTSLAIGQGHTQYSGLWVFKDDHTDVRILGALSKILPELFSLNSVQQVILEDSNNPLKATSAARSYERVTTVTVQPNQGNPEVPYQFVLRSGMKCAMEFSFPPLRRAIKWRTRSPTRLRLPAGA